MKNQFILLLTVTLFFFSNSLYSQCATPSSVIINGDFSLNNSSGDLRGAHVPGWYSSYGTPTLSTGANSYGWMWSYIKSAEIIYGEGIFTCYDFQSLKTYEISMDVSTNRVGNIVVKATNGLAEIYSSYSATIGQTPTSEQLIASDATSYTSTTNLTFRFTANQNYKQLQIFPEGTTTSQFELRVDNISPICSLNKVDVIGTMDAKDPCLHRFETSAKAGNLQILRIMNGLWETEQLTIKPK